jgi:glycosyltransferase involved in cell wall biosynthesis
MQISVIVPAFNAGATLAATLDSIAVQTRVPSEVIVVDDGSTDDTPAIAAAHPVRPRLIRQTNMGPAAAINRGVAEARADVLAVLDSDDLWDADWLAKASDCLAQTRLPAVFGRMTTFLDPGLSATEAAELAYQTQADVGIVLGACLIGRDVFLSLGGLNADLQAGYFIDFYHRFVCAGHDSAKISGTGLQRRIRKGSWSQRASLGGTLAERPLTRDFLRAARAAVGRRKAMGDSAP